MTRKIDVSKLNMGGEIRGAGVPQPPNSIPIEQTPAVTLPLQGAGDAVKSPYSNAAGTAQVLQSYQGGGEAGVGYKSQIRPAQLDEYEGEDASQWNTAEDTRSLEEIKADGVAYVMDKGNTQQDFLDAEAERRGVPVTGGPRYTQRYEEVQSGNMYDKKKYFVDNQTGQKYEITGGSRASASGPNYEAIVKKENTKEKALLKQKYGDDFDEVAYDKVTNLTSEQREQFLPDGYDTDKDSWGFSPGEYGEGTSNTGIYGGYDSQRILQKQMEDNQRLFDVGTFDALLQREGLKGRFDAHQGDINLIQRARVEQLENLDALTPAEQTELQGLKGKEEFNETSAELYEAIYDLDKRLNFQGEYDEGKFTQSTQRGKNISKATGAANEWLEDHLGFVGGMLGETIVSGGDLIRPGGSSAKFWEALTSDQQEGLQDAALDLGYDLFNVLSLLTVTGGAAGMGVKTLLTSAGKVSAGASMRGLVGGALKKGLSALGSQWAATSTVGKWALLSSPGIIKGGIYAAENAMGTANALDDLQQGGLEFSAGAEHGMSEQEQAQMREYKKQQALDPSKSYKDMDSFLAQNPQFDSLADAYRQYHPGEEVPENLQKIEAEGIALEDIRKLEMSLEGADVSGGKENIIEGEKPNVSDKVKGVELAEGSSEKLVQDLNTVQELEEELTGPNYSADDQAFLVSTKRAMERFRATQSENKYYDYMK